MADSSDDWPQEFSELRTIDSLLRCPICYEYMEAAVSLKTCLHSFCSVCVRRYLSKYQKDCPQCHGTAAESDITANRALGELVHKFRRVRGRLLSAVRSSGTSSSQAATSTTIARPGQPVAMPTQSAPTRRASRVDICSVASTRAADTSTDVSAQGPISVEDDYPQTYQFSEPWQPATPTARTATSRQKATAKDSHRGQLNDAQTAAAVPEPPQSMPDTQQILEDDLEADFFISREVRVPASIVVTTTSADLALSSPPRPTAAAGTVGSSSTSADSERVPCPICLAMVPSRSVNTHLDRCLTQEKHKPQLPPAPTATPAAASYSTSNDTTATIHRQPASTKPVATTSHRSSTFPSTLTRKQTPSGRKSMPRLVYTLLSDKQLRKHLRDNGLPTHGSKQAMIKRHQEFVLRYNADADSSNPRSAAEIARSIEDEERSRGGTLVPAAKTFTADKQKPLRFDSHHSLEDKDKLRHEYANQHSGHFKDLIDQVREQRGKKRKVSSSVTASEPTSTPGSPQTPSVVRPTKTRSSPHGQPAPKKRRSSRRQQAAVSDEDMPSDSDCDIDPNEFLKSNSATPASQTRRSTRPRLIRQSYIDAPSADDDDNDFCSTGTATDSSIVKGKSPPTLNSQQNEPGQGRSRTSRRHYPSKSSSSKLLDLMENTDEEQEAEELLSRSSRRSKKKGAATESSVEPLPQEPEACDSDATAEYRGSGDEDTTRQSLGVANAADEDFSQCDSQPFLPAPVQAQGMDIEQSMASVTTNNKSSLQHSTTINGFAGAYEDHSVDDAETQFQATPDSSSPCMVAANQAGGGGASFSHQILAEETQMLGGNSPVKRFNEGGRLSSPSPVKTAAGGMTMVIEETQGFGSPVEAFSSQPMLNGQDLSSVRPPATASDDAMQPVGKKVAGLSRRQRRTAVVDSQISDPTYDPFVVETCTEAVDDILASSDASSSSTGPGRRSRRARR